MVQFAITKDGSVRGLEVIPPSGKLPGLNMAPSLGNVSLGRPAFGAVIASDPFPALPDSFTGPDLDLRFSFYYNPDKSEIAPTPPPNRRISRRVES